MGFQDLFVSRSFCEKMFTSNKCCSRFHRSPPSCCRFQKQPGGVPALLSPGLWMVFSIQMVFLTLDSFYPSGNWRHDAPAGLRDRADGQSPEAQGLHLQGWFGIIDSVQSFFYGMAIFSITTLPITIAKNNQFVQSPILTESPNSTTAPARRRWRNIPISWEWSLCLQTILGDNHFRSSAKQQITRDSFHGLYRGADATMGRDVGSKKRWRWCSRRDLEVGSHLIAVECCTL